MKNVFLHIHRQRFPIRRADLYAGLFVIGVLAATSVIHNIHPFGARAAINATIADMSEDEKAQYARNLSAHIAENEHVFTNLNKDEIILLLDRPQLVRHDGPVQVWQYSSTRCILDLYLQDKHTSRAAAEAKIIHYETRPRARAHLQKKTAPPPATADHAVQDQAPPSCLTDIMSQKAIN